MSNILDVFVRINTGLWAKSPQTSKSFYGGYRTLYSDISIGNTSIVVTDSSGVNNFTYFHAGCRIKLYNNNTGDYEYAIVSSYTIQTSPSRFTLYLTEPTTKALTTAAGRIYIENYFGFSMYQNYTNIYGNFSIGSLLDVSDITKDIDIRRGGNTQIKVGGSIDVKNTDGFAQWLELNSIYLHGNLLDLYLNFTNTSTITQLGSYKIDNIHWNATTINIPFIPNPRNVNITKQINKTDYPNATKDLIGRTIPVTFGKIYPNSNWSGYAKFVRTADSQTDYVFNLPCYDLSDNYLLTGSPPESDVYTFPCVGLVGAAPTNTYKFCIASTSLSLYSVSGTLYTLQTSGTHYMENLVGSYTYVVEGISDGEYRKISNAIIDLDDDPTGKTIKLTMQDYYKEALKGNATATETDNSWINIINLKKEYQSDIQPCKSVLDNNGNEISTNFDLYVYDSEKKIDIDVSGLAENVKSIVQENNFDYLYMPNTSHSVKIGSNNNTLEANFRQCTNNLDSIDSFINLPLNSFELAQSNYETYQAKWGYPTEFAPPPIQWYDVSNGIFSVQPSVTGVTITGTGSEVIDKNNSTYYGIFLDVPDYYSNWLAFGFDVTMPSVPKNFDYSNVYLGIKASIINTYSYQPATDNFTKLFFLSKRFMGSVKKVELQNTTTNLTNTTYDCINDEYYNVSPQTNNRNFYAKVSDDSNLTGYEYYDITDIISDVKKYNSYNSFSLFYEHKYVNSTNATWLQKDFRIFEICLIFKRTVSSKKELYAPFSGRIFNNTWGSRKISASLITSPVDILEHTCRLQNYSEVSLSQQNYGLEYANYAKVSITSNGGFDVTTDSTFNTIKSYQIGSVVDDYSKTYTDSLKKDLCKQFRLANWTDKNGNECVKAMHKNSLATSTTITLSDIYNRDSITIQLPETTDVYPMPIVRYNKDFASGQYQGLLQITNTNKETYDSSYTKGFDVADASLAADIWSLCRTLYSKTKSVDKPPADMTDLYLVNGPNAYDIAKYYLYYWVQCMNNRIFSFDVHINKCYTIDLLDRININFPHQTEGVNLQSIVTKIIYKLTYPYNCKISVIPLT